MEQIGLYHQLTAWTSQGAGTAEWCKAERNGQPYFIKKFLSPVYPSKDLGLPEKKYQARVNRFHQAQALRQDMYQALQDNNTSGALVIPVEVINYHYHICTIAPFVNKNISTDQVCRLSEWQRLVLMRTLTLALNDVHRAGIIHCDMKPDNVLIYQDPANGYCALKLIDFDGSCLASSPPENIFGDPAYFAPEAYAKTTMPDIHLDQQIDIFALGIIFHVFWTGKLPERDADMTLGQYVLKGSIPKPDESIPPALKSLIERALIADPVQRISGEEIYAELGKILSDYPVKTVNLQKEKKDSGKAAPERKTIQSTDRHEEPKHYLAVKVEGVDPDGTVVSTRTVEVEYGTKISVFAKNIPDYHLISTSGKVEVTVSKDGTANINPVRFTYKKDSAPRKGRKFLAAVLVIAILYYLIMFLVTDSFINQKQYDQAEKYMNLLPFSRDIFPDKYQEIQEEQQKSRYAEAMRDYESGKYAAAYEKFQSFNSSYKRAQLYKVFCQAHLNGPEDYYDTIYSNIYFEDAAALIVSEQETALKFMAGTWQVQGNGDPFEFIVQDDGDVWRITNLPDSPGGGYFSIDKGVMYYEKNDSKERLHKITVLSQNKVTFDCYTTGIQYTLTRK